MHATLFTDVCRLADFGTKLRVLSFRCCNPTDRRGLPSLPRIPDIASVSRRHSWHVMLSTDVTRSKTLDIATAENRKGTRNISACTCATYKNLRHRRENQNPAVPAQHTTQKDVSASTNNYCAPHHGKLCQHQDVQGSVSSCSPSLYRCNQNSSQLVHTMCLPMNFVSLWTRRDIVFHGMRFSAHRQLILDLTRNPFFLAATVALAPSYFGCSEYPYCWWFHVLLFWGTWCDRIFSRLECLFTGRFLSRPRELPPLQKEHGAGIWLAMIP